MAETFQQHEAMTPGQAQWIHAAVRGRVTVLIEGPVQTGITYLRRTKDIGPDVSRRDS